MDKDRREAERSGDSIRYALELRRSGEDLRAKRLLQDLAWDSDDAVKALNDLYPIWPEHDEILTLIEADEAAWRSWANEIAGSIDPRVNHCLAESIPNFLTEYRYESEVDQFQNCFELLKCREQGPRLKSEDYWSDRLEWAEPLPAEMSDFLNWLDLKREGPRRHRLNEYSDVRLGWALFRLGDEDLLRRWAQHSNRDFWRERTLLARLDKTLSVTLAPEGRAVPSWVQCRLLPNCFEVAGCALSWIHYFEPGKAGEPRAILRQNLGRGHLLFLSDSMRMKSQSEPLQKGNDRSFRNALVSDWQKHLGDRFISALHLQGFVFLWEFGQLKTVLNQLIEVFNETRDSHEEEGEMRIGVAAVSGDIKASFALAKSRCEKAVAEGVAFLPECLTD